MAPSDTCKILPPPMKQQRATRSTANWSDHKVEIQRSKTDYHQNSFIPHISRLWNRLPCDVVGDLREPVSATATDSSRDPGESTGQNRRFASSFVKQVPSGVPG
jgi:hypothetical protein